ncbi:MAG: TRAP transporter substrate-binding protein [Geminicoccaceae bacterium]|nr:TRAP transporter substrate-binding protein [Geminicoccaceae bacterium]
MDRRSFSALAATAAVTAAMPAGKASAAESWRMASKMPTDSPEGVVFQYFADAVAEHSNGELTVKVFPNEQLGKTDAVMEQLGMGTVQLYAEGSTFMDKWVPDISWVSAAFLFDDRDHWVRFCGTDLVRGWYKEAQEKAGVTLLGDPTAILRGPFRVMVSKRDVQTFDDIQGIKLRMHPDELAHATWTHLGADVKTLAWTDVYQAIDKGIVEAVNSPIALVESMRFQEVAPHIIRHDEYYQAIGFMMNLQAYESLSDAQREAIDKAYRQAGDYSFEVMNSAADESLARMAEEGVTYLEIDRQPFIDSMKGFYKDLDGKGELPEGFLDAVESVRQS